MAIADATKRNISFFIMSVYIVLVWKFFIIAARARPRWLSEFFISAFICAKLSSNPSGINTGSYPKPSLPQGDSAIVPSTLPSNRCSSPSIIKAMAVRKAAFLFDFPSRRFNKSRILAVESWLAASGLSMAANLAVWTPGSPPSASTSRPVSSAKQGSP